jgi:serine/threonine protein kinase
MGVSAIVHRCVHRIQRKEYAAKIIYKLDKSVMEKLTEEVEIMKDLSHPSILRFYDSFEMNQKFYIILEVIFSLFIFCLTFFRLYCGSQLARGGHLQNILDERKKIEEVDCKKLLVRLCSALEYIHQQGIVHRDLKPGSTLFLFLFF